MSPELRYAEVVRLKLCANCFRGGHFASQCRLGPCRECGRRHHTLIHRNKPVTANNVVQISEVSEVTNTNNPNNNDMNAHSVSLSSCIASQVLLSTAVVKIVDEKTNQCHEVRALLDSGSQSSFITNSLKQRLGLLSQRVPSVNVTGINNMCFNTMERCLITLKIKQFTKQINCLTINQISTNLPSEEVDIISLDIPQNIQLADPTFYRPSQVELLLGADVFWDLIIAGQIKLGHNKPMLHNSLIGWLVVGPTMCTSYDKGNNINCNFSQEIKNQLSKFWELEELPPKLPWSQEEILCEDHFVKNTHRLNNGKFCVSLPLKGDPKDLGDSFPMAFKRLLQLENRFRRQPHVKQQHSETDWPSQLLKLSLDLPEIKVATVTLKQPNKDVIDIEKFSKFNKLRRTVAFMFRFIHNCKNSNNKIQGSLTVKELQTADVMLISLAQLCSFENEVNSLEQGKHINIKSKLLTLNPYLDAEGVMRVGGRLNNSMYDYNKKHPVILDSKHYLTKLLFEHFHIQLLHAGPQLLLSSIREMYWPLGGRHLARQTYRKCVVCKRVKGEVAGQIMGSLPSQRITPGFPFQIVGTDYAGPFYILNKKGRGARLLKAYLCLFVCFKTKAVHLELASDLSTEGFILAFRRFISRRGKPLEIFSDNGRNFVGASKELGKFLTELSDSVSDNFSGEGIQFRFSPAYSPNYGGLFEAGIKSAKFHIKRIVGNIHLTAEELATVFVQVEAILNSRPLYPISSDPHDLSPLSPGHFLIGRPLTSLPAPDLREVKTHLLHRYAKIEQMRQHFWSRWSQEYICELQQRKKWLVKKPNMKPGQLVLIKEEHNPPLKWPLGRIKQLYPGTDGCSRVADVETTKGTIRRAITRLCPLLDEGTTGLEAP